MTIPHDADDGQPGRPVGPQPAATGFGLGWPWDQLGEAVLRADDAGKRAWAAQVAGDKAAQAAAEWDRLEALGHHQHIRQQLADLWIAGMRAALDLDPVAVGVWADRFPVPDAVREAVHEVQEALYDVEDRVRLVESAALVPEGAG